MTTLPDVLTVDQVAELLDCTSSTIEEKARLRELPGIKFGRGWIFPREAVLKVINDLALKHFKPAEPAPAPAPSPQRATPLQVVPKATKPVRRHNPLPLPDPPVARA